jgi:hypothetical protein
VIVCVVRYPSDDGLRIKTCGGAEFSRHVLFADEGVINKVVDAL